MHTSLEAFAESTKLLAVLFPDYRSELRSLGLDDERNHVIAYQVARGTHTGEGGPVPPTGKAFEVDVVYVMEFDGDRIRHLTIVMHDLVVDKQLGWA